MAPYSAKKDATTSIKAFSLVELLVVITIIAVLMSFLMPAISNAREEARNVLCKSNLKQLMLSSLVYSDDFKGDVPYGSWDNSSPFIINFTFSRKTRAFMFNNYGVNRAMVWMCPSGVYRDRHRTAANYMRDSYYATASGDDSWDDDNNRDRTGYAYFAGRRRQVANTVAIDYQMPSVLQFAKSINPSLRIVWADALKLNPYSDNAGSTNFMPANTHAHNGSAVPKGTNNAFVDGHVEWRNYKTGINTMNMNRQYFLYFKE